MFLVEQNAFHALKLAHRGYVMVNGAITLTRHRQGAAGEPGGARRLSRRRARHGDDACRASSTKSHRLAVPPGHRGVGGGAAWMTGRAIATDLAALLAWRSLHVLLLAFASASFTSRCSTARCSRCTIYRGRHHRAASSSASSASVSPRVGQMTTQYPLALRAHRPASPGARDRRRTARIVREVEAVDRRSRFRGIDVCPLRRRLRSPRTAANLRASSILTRRGTRRHEKIAVSRHRARRLRWHSRARRRRRSSSASPGRSPAPNAAFGAQLKNGAEQAVEDINAAGGILGQKIAALDRRRRVRSRSRACRSPTSSSATA